MTHGDLEKQGGVLQAGEGASTFQIERIPGVRDLWGWLDHGLPGKGWSQSTDCCWASGRLRSGARRVASDTKTKEAGKPLCSRHPFIATWWLGGQVLTLSGSQILHPPDENSGAVNMLMDAVTPDPHSRRRSQSRVGLPTPPYPLPPPRYRSQKQRH